jgi:hypothetical protein
VSYTANRAIIESCLSRAHGALAKAMRAADEDGDDSLWLDLQLMQVELVRLAEGSLRGKAKRSILADPDSPNRTAGGP